MVHETENNPKKNNEPPRRGSLFDFPQQKPYSMPASTTKGEMAEWFKATVLKTVVLKGTVSSNLTLSARIMFYRITK
jgi:hypothetical protein